MYAVRVGMDDENVGLGPDECRGHQWVLHSLQLVVGTASMVTQCRWCGALSYDQPGARTK